VIFFRIPGVRRTRSGVWWLTVFAMLAAAALVVGVMVLVGR
jgi:uncharacterized membrane protein